MQIYIHIPFCEQKCSYCRFASVGKIQNLHIAKYVDFLCKEISLTPNPSPLKERGVFTKTIYFGGGTPGVLTLEQLEKIFSSLKNKFIFSDDIEITLETTPDKITQENLIGWNKLGINRLSMGVQTLNYKSLETIGRGNKGDIEKALKNLSSNPYFKPHPSPLLLGEGIVNISLDFIIGLPHVKKGEIKKDIEYILNKYNFIKHISVYMLEDYYSADKIKPHSIYPRAPSLDSSNQFTLSPNRREVEKKGLDKENKSKFQQISYPEDWGEMGIREEEYLGEYSEIKQYLESKGFSRYEISNYAKPGFECKHNQGYWNHSKVLGFGLGAYGLKISPSLSSQERDKIEYTRYANSENFSEYYEGKRILETTLTSEDIFLETVMFQLRTGGLKEDIYTKLNQEKLGHFMEEGYLEKKEGKYSFPTIILSDKGVLVMDYILGEII